MQNTSLQPSRFPTPSTNWREKFITVRGEETTREGEQQHLKAAAKQVEEIMQEIARLGDGTVRHGQHAVTHWAGDMQIQILEDIPAWAQCGIFARAGETFPGKLRLSGGVGFLQSDKTGDARGFALDVIVDGMHQGFLASSQPANFAANGYEFVAFNEAMLRALRAGKSEGNLLKRNKTVLFFQLYKHLGATQPKTFAGRIRAIIAATRINNRLAKVTAKGPLRGDKSLANLQFWSGGPIKIGPFAARFTLVPHPENGNPVDLVGKRSDHYLGEEFRAHLAQGDVKYTLALQFFVDEKRTPIEIAHKAWDDHAITVPAAKVTINMGAPYDPKAAEYRYSQFHTLGDVTDVDENGYPKNPGSLLPLCHLQRIRELVYVASADARGGPLQPIDAT